MALAVLALTMIAGEPARATTPGDAALLRDGVFARDRYSGVDERPHPDYATAPLRAGMFAVTPSVAVAVGTDDNIYAATDHPAVDTIFHLKPSIMAASTWSRHALDAAVSLDSSTYARHGSENTVNAAFSTDGRIDLHHDLVFATGVRLARTTESRTETVTQTLVSDLIAHPVRYDSAEVYAGYIHTVGRYRLAGRLGLENLAYDNARTDNGATVYQRDRDRATWTESTRLDYALAPGTGLFARAVLNQRAFRHAAAGEALRDSSGYDVELGAHLGLTHVVQGEAAVGYLRQSYAARAYPTAAGLSFDGRVRWLATELTTVTVSARRAVEDAGIPNVSGYLATRLSVAVDHELLRNLLLTAQLSRTWSDFQGYPRRDEHTGAHAGVRYLMNRAMVFTLALDRAQQLSSGPAHGARFAANRLQATLTYAL